MGSWGLFRRRAAAKPVRSHYRKQQDALRAKYRRGLRIEQFEERALLSIGTWVPVGPAPINYGQVTNVAPKSVSGAYLDQVAGAVTAVAASPTNANILYIGTANGGIWRTSDATDANPTWTPLTDNMPSLSIGSLAFDPTDASGQTLVAGIADTSEYGRAGGPLTGILRTTDGGATWTQLDGGGTLDGKDCLGIAARGNTILVAVDNATSGSYSDVGIFRSTNGGATFTQISKTNGASPRACPAASPTIWRPTPPIPTSSTPRSSAPTPSAAPTASTRQPMPGPPGRKSARRRWTLTFPAAARAPPSPPIAFRSALATRVKSMSVSSKD